VPVDKIKRSLIWLRKTFRIIEETTLPGQILGEIRPTVDAMGWERRLEEVVNNSSGAAAANIAFGPETPGDVLRLVTAASVEHNDATQAIDLSIWQRTISPLFGTTDVALIDAVTIPIGRGGAINGAALLRPIVLKPGDRLIGRSFPAPAGAAILRIKMFFIDVELGEYVATV